MQKVLYTESELSLHEANDGVQSMPTTGNVRYTVCCRWLVCMAEVVQIHRLSDEESGSLEGVPDLQFGVIGFNDRETSITFVTKDTTSVGQPCHFYPVSGLQIIDMNTFAFKGCTLYVSARGE